MSTALCASRCEALGFALAGVEACAGLFVPMLKPEPRHDIAHFQLASLDPDSRHKTPGEMTWYRRVPWRIYPRNLVLRMCRFWFLAWRTTSCVENPSTFKSHDSATTPVYYERGVTMLSQESLYHASYARLLYDA